MIRIARILINVTAATRYERLSFGNTRKVATILKKRKRKRKSLREICPYWFLFSPNAGKYGPEKLRIWTLSTWWIFACKRHQKIKCWRCWNSWSSFYAFLLNFPLMFLLTTNSRTLKLTSSGIWNLHYWDSLYWCAITTYKCDLMWSFFMLFRFCWCLTP